MTQKAKKIHDIAHKLISFSQEKDEALIMELYRFYSDFPNVEDHQGDIQLQNGIALSKKNAADCIKDYKRTACFLRGIHKAIIECTKKFPNTTLTILYAGCGPYAPLLTPLLSFFEPKHVQITLLDINQSSIASVKNIIKELGYEAYIKQYCIADATQYTHPKDQPLHIIITETMFHALTKEPQVAVTQNLAPQLTQGGILIPEEITVSMGYSFFSKEPFLNQYNNTYYITNLSNENLKRKTTTTLFSIDKTETKETNNSSHPYFESTWYTCPKDYKESPDICIYTRIKVFDTFYLQHEDSLITNPYCLASLHNIQDQHKFKIKYSIQNTPNWEITVN